MSEAPTIPIWQRTHDGLAFSDVPEVQGGRMPDFCIIGAAKAGTSSLNAYLAEHPGIFMCPLKEPNYFSTSQMRERGDQWYRGLYAPAGENQLCGEASTSYTRWPAVEGVAARLATANPAMKIIYALREPVARAQSDCLQVMKYAQAVLGEDHTETPLDQVFTWLSDPANPYYCAPFETGLYARQLAEYSAHFAPERILLVTIEKLGEDTAGTLERVLVHLGLPFVVGLGQGHRRNVTADYTRGLAENKGLDRLRRLPLYALAKWLLPARQRAWLRREMARRVDISHLQFSNSLAQTLHRRYAPHNDALRDLSGLPLPGWSSARDTKKRPL